MIHFNHNGSFKFISTEKAEKITAIINDYRSAVKHINKNKNNALNGILGAYKDNDIDSIEKKTDTLKRLRKRERTKKKNAMAKLKLLGLPTTNIDDFIEDWENYVKYYETVLF